MTESKPSLPQSFGILLFPAFQALDAFGPLDALNVLSETHDMTLSIIAPTLSPIPTAVGQSKLSSTFSQSILPTHTYATAPPLDVLLIPGGVGTRAPDITPAIDFIRTIYPSLQYLITVCTGAGLAARAGLLDGKRATTNKATWALTTAFGPKVKWVPKARWVVDGKVWTSAGGSAGIDVTLAWVGEVFGEGAAGWVADGLEYERCLDSGRDPFAEKNGLVGEEG